MKDKVEGFRLSPQQTRLWLQQRGSAAYRSQCALLIEGSLREKVLENSFLQLSRRHEILRTTFHRLSGLRIPLQVIAEEGAPAWRVVDLSREDFAGHKTKIDELFAHERDHDLDFEKGPLLRLCLVKSSATRHVLIVSLPALCADARSLDNLISEAFCFYGNSDSVPGAPLAEPLQYVDFSEWQNEILASDDAAKGEEYWRQLDRTVFTSATLPFAKRLFEKPKFAPSVFTSVIEPTSALRLKRIARRYASEATDILLASWRCCCGA